MSVGVEMVHMVLPGIAGVHLLWKDRLENIHFHLEDALLLRMPGNLETWKL